jgi:tetratricopeptide (TPR) repeat protein
MHRQTLVLAAILVLCCAALVCAAPAPAQAPVQTPPAGTAMALPAAPSKFDIEYNLGVAAYTRRDYAGANDLFWKSITDGNPSALVWLYMGHSKVGLGDLQAARKDYKTVVDIFKNTRESKAAAECIARLDVQLAKLPAIKAPSAAAATKTSTAAAKTSTPTGTASKAVSSGSFRSRIEIIQPKEGHPPVSDQMIATVKATLDRLPKSILKILDDGGARIFLGPNIIDKWPNALNDPKPGMPGQTLAEEPGRTYGHDIYIYERSVATQGSRELGEARSMTELQANLLHEIGHAVDDCLKVYSKSKDLQTQYKLDCSVMSDEEKESMSYYMQAGDAGAAEACAESVAILLGGQHKDNDRFNRDFPRTESWVKTMLKI